MDMIEARDSTRPKIASTQFPLRVPSGVAGESGIGEWFEGMDPVSSIMEREESWDCPCRRAVRFWPGSAHCIWPDSAHFIRPGSAHFIRPPAISCERSGR
jgi:hypothetical protein